MTRYRTAQGKIVDMAALAARNEKVRAVGNMSVNARGDTIDSHGRVVVPVTRKVGEGYQQTVTNRAAALVKRKKVDSPNIAKTDIVPEPVTEVVEEMELMSEEFEIENDDDALEIEKIKAAEANEASYVIKPASEARRN